MAETTTEVVLGTLTKNDIKAIRTAHVASFHASLKFGDWKFDGKSQICLTRRIRNAGPLDENEKSWRISCDSQIRDHAEGDEKASVWGNVRCFAMEHTCSMAEDWQTFASCCRVGDVVSLQWIKDHYRVGYARDENGQILHKDTLSLVLTRNGRRLVFNLCCSLCPHNSARMIRAGTRVLS